MSDKQANNSHKLSQKLADFTFNFNLSAATDKVIENAKLAILDCLGVAVLASAQEIGVNLLKFASANTSPGPCAIWGTDKSVSPRDAALINGTLAHGLDYDDRNHSTTYTLAASLAVAEQMNLSGAKMLEAFIVGREVRNSLDALFGRRSDGIGPGARGWHSNGILGPIAAACSASHALSLSVARDTRGDWLGRGLLRRLNPRRRHHGQTVSHRPRRRDGFDLRAVSPERFFQRRHGHRRTLRPARSIRADPRRHSHFSGARARH